MTTFPPRLPPAVGLAALLMLLAGPAGASVERARQAEARGALREAMIEYRNAVRREPTVAAVRAALAEASLGRGDGDTAEREARAALANGYDAAAATAMLARAYLLQDRPSDLLRDMPVPAGPPALAAEVAAGRAHALLALDQQGEAAAMAAEAVRRDAASVSAYLAVATVAQARGDRAAAEEAVDRALALSPERVDALLFKGVLLLARDEAAAAEARFAAAVARAPGNVEARLRRGEALLRLGQPGAARQEVDLVLREVPGSVGAVYLRAAILAGEEDWAAVEDSLQRILPALDAFPDGRLLLATAKRALGQAAQAEEEARRYVARRPEDPRGGRLLAAILVESDRSAEAVEMLDRLVALGAADGAAFEMLARLHTVAGRPREALAVLEQAARLLPEDPAIRTRLAAARLALGDAEGSARAAEAAVRLAPATPGSREVLASAALARGDIAAAEEALAALGPNAAASEAGAMLEGTIRLIRLDLRGARRSFETLLRANPQTIAGRIGLARVATIEGAPIEAITLLGEVLRRQPDNLRALRLLGAMAVAPDGAPALARLEAAVADAPGEPALALAAAEALIRTGHGARAVEVLDAPALRARLPEPRRLAALAEAHAAAHAWPEALAAGRAALAADPAAIPMRLRLARLLESAGLPEAAEALLREAPAVAHPIVQRTLVGLVQRQRGFDAALAVAADLPVAEGGAADAALLRGDLLLQARRPREAARIYAEAGARTPSPVFAMREAMAWEAAGEGQSATAVLDAWLARGGGEPAVLGARAQFAIARQDWEAAERLLEAAVRAAPLDAVALNNLAWVLARDETTPPDARAQDLAERAYYLLPGRQTADTLGWILFRRGDVRRAVPLLREAAAGDGALARLRLARALEAAGDPVEALRQVTALQMVGLDARDREAAEALRTRLGAAN